MKLFVFDVDGTLLPNGEKELKKNLIDKLNSILANNDVVCIASGRSFKGVKRYLDLLNEGKKYAICFNGALVSDAKGNIFYKIPLKFKDYKILFNHYKDYLSEECDIYFFNDLGVNSIKKGFFVNLECELNLENYIKVDDSRDDNEDIYKVLVSASKKVSYAINYYKEDATNYHLVRSNDYFVEFINKEVDKVKGVDFLKDYLKLNKEDIFTFGDGGNDLLMIKEYNGIAMGNSLEEVKKVAKNITLDCKNDGVIYAIDNIIKYK